jgi:hypothetical protein
METKDLVAALNKPFPKEAIKSRIIGGGKKADYVEGHTVINRLNEATGGVWSFEVLRIEYREKLVTATVRLTIPQLGSREHIGVQVIQSNAGEDLIKGVITDGLKKCSTLFGIGISLYGSDYEEEIKTKTETKSQAHQKRPDPVAEHEANHWGLCPTCEEEVYFRTEDGENFIMQNEGGEEHTHQPGMELDDSELVLVK